jgi:hypothetical protein
MRHAGGDRKHKRSFIKIVILTVLLCALAEPFIMYKVLAREREQRRIASQPPVSAATTLVVSTGE